MAPTGDAHSKNRHHVHRVRVLVHFPQRASRWVTTNTQFYGQQGSVQHEAMEGVLSFAFERFIDTAIKA